MEHTQPTVDAFLASLPADRHADLTALRALIRQVAPELEETMHYKMPTYRQADGTVIYAFNAQKQHLALYVGEVPEAFRDQLTGCNLGKGCIRFKRLKETLVPVFKEVLLATRHTPC